MNPRDHVPEGRCERFYCAKRQHTGMAQKLLLLLDNDELRRRFSDAAKQEITENGSIDKLCAGFRDALCYATFQTGRAYT